jgi:hypothetical protein
MPASGGHFFKALGQAANFAIRSVLCMPSQEVPRSREPLIEAGRRFWLSPSVVEDLEF